MFVHSYRVGNENGRREKVAGIAFILFILSSLLLFGGGNYFLASQRAGAYPPKRVLQQKAMAVGGAGAVLFLLAIFAIMIV